LKGILDPGAVPGNSTKKIRMSSCCTRKRTKKDLLFLPMAVGGTLLFFVALLTIEIGIAYALGFVSF